jgi:hypothetical protein
MNGSNAPLSVNGAVASQPKTMMTHIDRAERAFAAGALHRRLARLFHKRAGEGLCVKPFDHFPPARQHRLLAAAALQPDEAPVIACLFSEQHWTLLTTRRLLWQKHTHRAALPLDIVSHAAIHPEKFVRRHHDLPITLNRVKIITTTGQVHDIELEAGPCCFGFQYLLRKVTRRPSPSSA